MVFCALFVLILLLKRNQVDRFLEIGSLWHGNIGNGVKEKYDIDAVCPSFYMLVSARKTYIQMLPITNYKSPWPL